MNELAIYGISCLPSKEVKEQRQGTICDLLPEELIAYIFDMLDKTSRKSAAMVCRQFRRIALNRRVWNAILAVSPFPKSQSQDPYTWYWLHESGAFYRFLQPQVHVYQPITVTCAAFSHNIFYFGCLDGDVRICNKETLVCESFPAHSRPITCIALFEPKMLLLTGAFGQTVRLWDLEHKACLGVLTGYSGLAKSIAFAQDGTQILLLSKYLLGCDRASGEIERISSERPTCFTLSSDDSLLFIGYKTQSPRILNRKTGNTCKLHGQTETKVAKFSPDQTFVVSASLNHVVLWTAQSGMRICIIDRGLETTCIAFSPSNSKIFAVGSHEGDIKIWRKDRLINAFQEDRRIVGLSFLGAELYAASLNMRMITFSYTQASQ